MHSVPLPHEKNLPKIREDQQQELSLSALALTVIGPFALGYFMSYVFRSVNAVVAPDLVEEIGLRASELGFLTAAYLIAFAFCQLPLGILLDRFGPRRVQTVLFCCAALGAALFSIGESVLALTAARALIGAGVAGGLMAGFKAVVLWVPEPRRALAGACVMSFGALGLIVATVPAEFAAQTWGWRWMFAMLSGVTVAVAATIFLVVPERKTNVNTPKMSDQVVELFGLFRDRVFWRLAPLIALSGGGHIGIQTLWAGPWFRDVAGFDRDAVAWHLGIVAVAFLAGILLSGIIADRLLRRGIDLLTTMCGFLSVYLIAFGAIAFELLEINILMWFVFGMSGQVAVIAYPWMASYYGAALSGRANTAMNLLMFLSAFGVQYAVGVIIDFYPVTASGGYDPRGYQMAFGILLVLQIMAFGWYLLKVPRLPVRQTG